MTTADLIAELTVYAAANGGDSTVLVEFTTDLDDGSDTHTVTVPLLDMRWSLQGPVLRAEDVA